MAHAFAEGSVGLWVVNPANLAARLPGIAAFAGGMFTDVFVPRTATAADMALIRSTARPSGERLRAQLWTVPAGQTAPEYAAQVDEDIRRLKPGVVELDIEVPDEELGAFVRDTVLILRVPRPSKLLRVNIAPFKGTFLRAWLFQADPYLYAAEQTYYGDMSRVSEAEALLDLLENGVPAAKAALCYGAAAPEWPQLPNPTDERRPALGSLWYRGDLVRRLRRGLVFQDDLMVEVGLL